MNLHQRGTTYHLRIRVPSDLVNVIGRREIHQSLRTSDRRTAQSRAIHLKASMVSGFERLRVARMSSSRDEDLTELANGFLSNLGSTRRNRNVNQTQKKPLRLRELMDMHLEEKRSSIDPRSHDKMAYSFRLAIHYIGNIHLRSLDRSACRTYREDLKRSPQFLLRNDSASNCIDRVLSDKSVNHHLQYLSALLRWGTLEELVGGNPAEGLTITKRHRDWDERFAFDIKQLNHLLTSLWLDETRIERLWVPLIALWSGMRQEEICQLRHCDIVEREGIHCFAVTEEAGTVKSASAERLVPIHPHLIHLGFLDDVWAPEKVLTKERMWPNLRKSRLCRYSNAFCKWFSRYKTKKGFKDKRYCFHSIRHTFINEMKQREVPEPVIRQLVGHREASITLGRYGKDYELEKLNRYMKIVDFDLILDLNT